MQIKTNVYYLPTGLAKRKKKRPVLVKVRSNWNSYTLLAGMQGGIDHLENSLVAFYKVKHSPLDNPAKPLTVVLKRKKIYIHRNTSACLFHIY